MNEVDLERWLAEAPEGKDRFFLPDGPIQLTSGMIVRDIKITRVPIDAPIDVPRTGKGRKK